MNILRIILLFVLFAFKHIGALLRAPPVEAYVPRKLVRTKNCESLIDEDTIVPVSLCLKIDTNKDSSRIDRSSSTIYGSQGKFRFTKAQNCLLSEIDSYSVTVPECLDVTPDIDVKTLNSPPKCPLLRVKILTGCDIKLKLSSECEGNLEGEKRPGPKCPPELNVRQHLKEKIEDSNLETIVENTLGRTLLSLGEGTISVWEYYLNCWKTIGNASAELNCLRNLFEESLATPDDEFYSTKQSDEVDDSYSNRTNNEGHFDNDIISYSISGVVAFIVAISGIICWKCGVKRIR